MRFVQVFEIIYPGPWVEPIDDEKSRTIESLIDGMQKHLDSAAVTCELFSRERATAEVAIREAEFNEGADRARRRDAVAEFLNNASLAELRADPDAIERRVMDLIRRERRNDGPPQAYIQAGFHVLAAAFASTVDLFRRIMVRLVAESPGVQPALDIFDAAFPEIKALRDSLQHEEERILREHHHGKSIPATWFEFANIETDTIVCTAINGRDRVKVTIGEASVREMQRALQGAVDAHKWTGGEVRKPV